MSESHVTILQKKRERCGRSQPFISNASNWNMHFLIPVLLFSNSFYNIGFYSRLNDFKRVVFFALNNTTTAAGTIKWIMWDDSTPFFKNPEDRRIKRGLHLSHSVFKLNKCVNWIRQMEWEILSSSDQRHLCLSWLVFLHRFRAVVLTSILYRAILFIYSSFCSLKV